ncbi:hypothetical protein [Avibacterium paragallinarum]|uniref:Uncharacterized protein n=1 Tax=Avibacterium paragallinarum TaxID=728 RepID=A0ABU7QHL6_AVIPA|nr:hypothetical protein [Avibacterium paragallinarum]QZP14823.1 hypothetical protein K5O18_08290 [Avibacterium paragallinarum]WAL56756.1 hypothetical protein OY678_12710 [Avibacterium paragallinarum]WAM59268.1 hypothetical protein OW731_12360 [Avibacterium paragallinarum]
MTENKVNELYDKLVPKSLQKIEQQLKAIDPFYNDKTLKTILAFSKQIDRLSLEKVAALEITQDNMAYFSPQNIEALETMTQSEEISIEVRKTLNKLIEIMKEKAPKAACFSGVTLADFSLRKFFEWLLDSFMS